MTPQLLLQCLDQCQVWPDDAARAFSPDMAQAYQISLGIRALRLARGEQCIGYKVGFTNRANWPKQGVDAPMWAAMWASGLVECDGHATVDLSKVCVPRLEPEIVFGLRSAPVPDASLQSLYECLDWMAPGFEIVRCHAPGGKASAVQAVADGGMHSGLVVGRRTPVRDVAPDVRSLDARLAGARLTLRRDGEVIAQGDGTVVLGSPLQALHQFLQELHHCPGAPSVKAGDIITTGTWTDAMEVAPGQSWEAALSDGLGEITVDFR